MTGYVKLHRKFKNWEWYSDLNSRVVFMHLLLTVNYKDSRFQGHEVKSGSGVYGRVKLASDVGISEQQLRTALNKLKSTLEINIESTSKFSIITLNKWGAYQGFSNDNQPACSQHVTSSHPTDNQHVTTSKEGNKAIKEEGNKPKRKKKEPFSDCEIPPHVDKGLWDAFLDQRKKMKSPMTDYAMKLLIKDLIKFGDLANESLSSAIKNGWKAVYLPKNTEAQPQGKTAAQIATENFKRKRGLL